MTTKSNNNRATGDGAWKRFYRIGAIAAFVTILVMISEIVITLLPGGGRVAPEEVTIVNWFELFRDNWFLGLRNLGLINMIAAILLMPAVLALFGALKADHEPWAALALIISVAGAAVYLAGNTGFPMLALSRQYAAAATAAQRAAIEAAGQAMLALGESHTPGTFVPFLLIESSGLLNSWLMLRSESFARATAVAGLFGNALLLTFEFVSAFVPALFAISLFIALAGGLLSLAWYLLIGRDLLRLGRVVPAMQVA